MSATGAVLGLLETLHPTLGRGQLLCIDGRAGSGKSTLAEELAGLAHATVVHTDDLCPGWAGLPAVPGLLAALVAPLADGLPGTYARYDWIAGTVAEEVVVDPCDLLIIEGVGAGATSLRPWRTALVWLERRTETRRAHALARDGDTFAPFWEVWAAAEQDYLATSADRDRADLLLRGDQE